jgi:hypothetical protein
MSAEITGHLDYHSYVPRIAFLILLLMLVAAPALQAQIHGVPPSVTSFGPGRGPTPGVPASVTSLGPNGFANDNQFFTVPTCCMNPLFPINVNPALRRRHHHHHFVSFYPVGVPVYAPYYADIASPPVDDSMEEEEDGGGPTLFDRRGPARGSRYASDRYVTERIERRADQAREDELASSDRVSRDRDTPAGKAQSEPGPDSEKAVSDEPGTVLVYKDGRKVEVKNYAIVGDQLYDLTGGRSRKIPLAELDLEATQKLNEDQGINFQLPGHSSGT